MNATSRMNHRRESESDDIERRETRNARKKKGWRDEERGVDREKPVAVVLGRIRRRCGCRRLSEELFTRGEKSTRVRAKANICGEVKQCDKRRDENAKRKHGKVEDALEAETTELDGNERVRGPHRKREREQKALKTLKR